MKADCERYFRRLRLKVHFHDREDASITPDNDPFAKYENKTSTWTPPDGQFSAVDHYIDRCRRSINSRNYTRPIVLSNLPQEEKQALQDLRRRTDIIIKPADKGGAVVVWSRDLYNQEAHRQLSDNRFYLHLDADPTRDDQKIVEDTIRAMIATCELPPTAQHLVVSTPRTSRFYMLPKIHKPNSPGRPIVSACCCPTENIAAYLDEVMAPLVSCLPTYVKDTNDALRIFDTFTFDSSNDNPRFLFTMDIKSLYTVVPNNGGLQALSYFFDQRANKEPPTHTLKRLAELVLTLNAFSFKGEYSGNTRVYSDDADFTNRAAEMKEYFRARGHPDELVNNNLRNVPTARSSLLKSTPTSHDESTNTKVPLVLTYNPFNVGTRRILLDNFSILCSDPEARRIFPRTPAGIISARAKPR